MTFSDDHLAFALRCHSQLPVRSSSAWSPYSVATSLGLLAQGDDGAVSAELARLLWPSAGLDAARAALAASARLTAAAGQRGDDAPGLAVADRLWVGDGERVRPAYRAALARWPGSRIESAPFATEPDAARRAINADVATATHGLITDLLPPGAVTSDTMAALVNALWLKVNWRQRFHGITHDGIFHGEHGDQRVPLMRQGQLTVGFAESPMWQLVRLATAASEVVVEVLLPAGELREVPLATAERALDADTVADLIAAAASERVELNLPRLRVDTSFELDAPLHALGLHAGFGSPGVRGILESDDPLVISRSQHACVLRVDEDGVEGAAATAHLMVAASAVRAMRRVVVDHPFLLLVRNTTTGALYFLGRVADVPAAS